MEERHKTTVYVPKSLYDYLGTLGHEEYNFNKTFLVTQAYINGIRLSEEEVKEKIKEKLAQYYKLFLVTQPKIPVPIYVPRYETEYHMSDMTTIFILVHLDNLYNMLGTPEEQKYSVEL